MLSYRVKYSCLVMVKRVNRVSLKSQCLALLLKPRLALRNLQPSYKPWKYLCISHTSLPVETSYPLILPAALIEISFWKGL